MKNSDLPVILRTVMSCVPAEHETQENVRHSGSGTWTTLSLLNSVDFESAPEYGTRQLKPPGWRRSRDRRRLVRFGENAIHTPSQSVLGILFL